MCVAGDPGRRPTEPALRSTSRLLLLLLPLLLLPLFSGAPPFAAEFVVVVVDGGLVDVNLLIEKLLFMCLDEGDAGLDADDVDG